MIVQIEIFFHFVGVEHRTDREPDLGGAVQRIALTLDRGFDGCEVLLSGTQQLFALAAALGGQIGIAADHQSLAGEVGGRDAGHIAFVEQRELQGAAVQQVLDRRSAQRGDPVQACGWTSSPMRASVIMPRSPTNTTWSRPKRCFSLSICGASVVEIAGVAVEHLDRHRTTVRCTEHAIQV